MGARPLPRRNRTRAAAQKRVPIARKAKVAKQSSLVSPAAADPENTRQLRNKIFPTLYAIFQRSRGTPETLKIRNRSLRSLFKSCLYHKTEAQLQRTSEDAEALLQKYCAGLHTD